MKSSITERNPCPKCGKRPALMAGINMNFGDIYVLVCWRCMMVRKVLHGEEWKPLGKRPKIAWKKHNATHWQTVVDGRVLDYWPTKRKWRFENATHKGDVNRFIRGLRT